MKTYRKDMSLERGGNRPRLLGLDCRNADADSGRTGERAIPRSGKAGQEIFRESV